MQLCEMTWMLRTFGWLAGSARVVGRSGSLGGRESDGAVRRRVHMPSI